MVSLVPFQDGINAAMKQNVVMSEDPRTDFMQVLRSHGIKVKDDIRVGFIERLDGTEDKCGKKSAWYIYHEFETKGGVIGVGDFGDWKTGLKEQWQSFAEHKMNKEQRAEFIKIRESILVQRKEEEQRNQKEAAEKAYGLWIDAPSANDTHPYLLRKKVMARTGVKINHSKTLIIPIAVNNAITSLQFIDEDGSKRFLRGGKIKGGWFIIEGKDSDVIYIAEGYSTADSIHQATDATVYVAFNANNIYEVSAYAKEMNPKKLIIIAGDDDFENKVNTGRNSATYAAEGLGIDCVFPADGFVDFNDMHNELGLQSLTEHLKPNIKEAYQKKKYNIDEIEKPDGVLGQIYDYYNTTSGNKQHGFSLQTSLALVSIVLARSYKTTMDNYTSLYLLNVGKSGTGKEHSKTVIERILHDAGIAHYMAGDGYTSAGAVMSTLLDKPKHISIIDEFGRYLEACKSGKGSNAHQREANTKLMESIGRGHTIMRPANYSSMTLGNEAAKAVKNRLVHNPAITLLTMTTQDTLFNSLDIGSIKDGFINRFIISISNAERSIRTHKPMIDVPEGILNWIDKVRNRYDAAQNPSEPSDAIILRFSEKAMEEQYEFQKYCIDKADDLEKLGMSEIPMRSNEMAMRISLIHALSRDPFSEIIELRDIRWAINYIKTLLDKTIKELKMSISHSEYEGDKKHILLAIREKGEEGILFSDMIKTPPFSKFKIRDLKEMLDALKNANLISNEIVSPNKTGRTDMRWIALM